MLTRGSSLIDGIFQDEAAIAAARLANNLRIETEAGVRYITQADPADITLASGNFAKRIYENSSAGIFADLAALQAASLPNGLRAELLTGERYYTNATDIGDGVLLASGNYAIPIGGGAVIGVDRFVSGTIFATLHGAGQNINIQAPAGQKVVLTSLHCDTSFITVNIVDGPSEGPNVVASGLNIYDSNSTGTTPTSGQFGIGPGGRHSTGKTLLDLGPFDELTVDWVSGTSGTVYYAYKFVEYIEP